MELGEDPDKQGLLENQDILGMMGQLDSQGLKDFKEPRVQWDLQVVRVSMVIKDMTETLDRLDLRGNQDTLESMDKQDQLVLVVVPQGLLVFRDCSVEPALQVLGEFREKQVL